MEAVTPTTTRSISGLARLATLSERPLSRAAAIDSTRAFCLPWLTPTREVVEGLVSDYCAARYLAAEGDPPTDPQVEGPSLAGLIQVAAPDVDAEMCAKLDATAAAMQRLKDTTDGGTMAYDQMLGESNPRAGAGG